MPTVAANTGMVGAIQAAAPSIGVELSLIDVRDAGEIEHAVTAFARSPNGGLIVTGGALATLHRDVIIRVAARHRLPAVYSFRYYITRGGLISDGGGPMPSTPEQYASNIEREEGKWRARIAARTTRDPSA